MSRVKEVYQERAPRPPRSHIGERLSVRRAIAAVKGQVSCLMVADHYAAGKEGGWRRLGIDKWTRRCILPGHDDKTPSFVIYEATDSFYCFACCVGGDAVTLEKLAGRHERTWTAVIELSQRYNVELPRRSEKWHRRQPEQVRQWHQLRDVLAESYRRRLFRVLAPVLREIGVEEGREQEARAMWDALWPTAQDMAARRLYGDRSGKGSA